MNTTGCAYPFATDEIFQLSSSAVSCNSSMVTFWFLAAFSLVLRLIPALKQALNWKLHSLKRAKVNGMPKRRRNFPMAQITSMIEWTFFLVLFLLSGFNIVNMGNAWSLSLLSAAFLFFACSFTVSYVRFVRLGNRILPRAHRTEENQKSLSTLDGFGKLALHVQIASLVFSSVILIIIGPIIPEHDVLLGKLAFAFKINFECFCVFGCIWQLERCKGAIFEVAADVKKLQLKHQDYSQAIWTIRKNQVVYCLFAFPLTIVFALLICDVIPWTYQIVIVLPFLCESVAFMVQVFRCPQRKKRNEDTQELLKTAAAQNFVVVTAKMISHAGTPLQENQKQIENHDGEHHLNAMSSGTSVAVVVDISEH